MKKFLCIKTCFVGGHYYEEGSIFPFSSKPNRHFEEVKKSAKPAKVVKAPETLKEVSDANEKEAKELMDKKLSNKKSKKSEVDFLG